MPALAKKTHIVILDYIRALAIIRIFMYHYYLEWFGGSYFIVPEGIGVNLQKMWVFEGAGVLNDLGSVLGWGGALIKNIFSWFFLYGFATVNVFLVLSGFVLTLSLLNKGGSLLGARTFYGWVLFYWKRLRRIMVPFYISVLAGILFWYLRNLFFPQFADWPLFNLWDLANLLVVPYIFFDILLLQKFSGDYWFIVLILQLYLLFPLMFFLLKKVGVWKFLILMAILTFAYRFYAVFNLDSVPMGINLPTEFSYRLYSFFLPRMFEFALGMGLGYLYFQKENLIDEFRKLRWFLIGVGATVLGYILLMYRIGWIFSDAVLAFGLFFVFFGIANWLENKNLFIKSLSKIGESAYEIYLWHHYFLNYLLMYLLVVLGLKGNEWVFWGVMPVYFVIVVLLGYFGSYLTVGLELIYKKVRGRK